MHLCSACNRRTTDALDYGERYKIVFSLNDLQVSDFFETATLSTTRGHNHNLFKNVVQLMYDRSFSVNGWLTAGMICLLPLISVPSLVLPAVLNVFISLTILDVLRSIFICSYSVCSLQFCDVFLGQLLVHFVSLCPAHLLTY